MIPEAVEAERSLQQRPSRLGHHAVKLLLVCVGQIAIHLALYWARAQTFVVTPGRFDSLEWLLGSDWVLFGVPWLSALVLLILVIRDDDEGWLGSVAQAAAAALPLATVDLGVALLVAFNVWGS